MTPFKKSTILVFCLLILFGLEYLGFLVGMNNYFYDLAFRLRGSEKPQDNIIVAAIDEKTLAELGPWPIQRTYYASLLEKTKLAEVVAFDVMMAETTPGDDRLAQAMKRYAPTVLPIIIKEDLSIEDPVQTLSATPAGHVHIERGIDGVAREIYHTLYFQGRRLPSFSSRIYELVKKRSLPRTAPLPEHYEGEGITQADLMRINYRGGPGTIRRVSFLDILQGVYPADHFKGKIVLVGITAMGLVDSVTTPYAETRIGTSGVEVQANIVDNLLLAEGVRVVPLSVSWLIGLAAALGLYVFFYRLTEEAGVLLLAAALVLYSLLTFLVFSSWHVWNPPAAALISFVVLLALAYLFKLQAAAVSLGATYASILPHLRNRGGADQREAVKAGLSGVLTPRGIQKQALVLNNLTHQLVFEKELSDRILLSDIFGVAVFDPEGRLIVANPDIYRLCTANEIFPGNRDRFIAELTPHVLERKAVNPAFDHWLKAPSITVSLSRPETRYLMVDLSLLSVEEKKYSLFILSDITKIKELEILKSQIVSIVSHELKTPMTNIQGFSELLAGSLEGELNQYAGIILEESVRLTKFVNTFLDINRIEEGRQPIRKTPVSVSALIRQVDVKMQPSAREKGIRLSAETPDETPPILIDKALTEQALLNLTENAIKYSPPNSRVTIRVTTEQPDSLKIDIADTGYGIREEELKRIFEKFYRANAEVAEDVKGSGLGLAFVKEAVEAQGGRVTVDSVFGQGSTFSLIFPKGTPEGA